MLRLIAFISMVLFARGVSAQDHVRQGRPLLRYDSIADRSTWNTVAPNWQLDSALHKPSGAIVLSRTVLGTLLGTSLGVAIGYGIDADTQDSWIGVTEGMLIGGVVGSTVSAPLAAYFANRRKGRVLLAVGSAVLMTVAAVHLAETDPVSAAIGLPIAHVGISVIIIRATE